LPMSLPSPTMGMKVAARIPSALTAALTVAAKPDASTSSCKWVLVVRPLEARASGLRRLCDRYPRGPATRRNALPHRDRIARWRLVYTAMRRESRAARPHKCLCTIWPAAMRPQAHRARLSVEVSSIVAARCPSWNSADGVASFAELNSSAMVKVPRDGTRPFCHSPIHSCSGMLQ